MSTDAHGSGPFSTRANSSVVSTGRLSLSRRVAGGASSSSSGARPSQVVRLITRSSRSESIAGLVTCAKRCLK